MITELKKNIKALYAKIDRIQNDCTHPESVLTREPRANTGNWDPSDDSYWYVFHCGLCDKSWTEPQ